METSPGTAGLLIIHGLGILSILLTLVLAWMYAHHLHEKALTQMEEDGAIAPESSPAMISPVP
jgi:hypothetical protein